MQATDATIREHLNPPKDGFWLWRDDCEVVTWRDGQTIAFGEELKAALKRLAPEGLPRLGSLLLLFAATRDNWEDGNRAKGILAGMLRVPDADPPPSNDLLVRVFEGLQKVHGLGAELRGSLPAKLAVIDCVFEDRAPAVAADAASAVADAIRPGLSGLLSGSFDPTSSGFGPISLTQDLAALASRLERITPEQMRLRARTGLDEIPAALQSQIPPEEELLPGAAARRVIEELLQSPEHQGVARGAKRLLASVSLPRPLTAESEQQDGGYSDIASRGEPDRLLLSELAQDGLVLAARVAMNEALYLRRETPPSTPHRRRELLIDAGVWSWGTPRVLATSAALALAATTSRNSDLAVWRGDGEQLQPVDLTTTEGAVGHLSALSPDEDLRGCLPAFAEQVADAEEPTEAFLLVPDEVLETPGFLSEVRKLLAEQTYLVALNREGGFRLIELRPRGDRVLRQATIDPDELFSEEAPSLRRESGRLPAIFHTTPFPLRLGPQPLAKQSWSLGTYRGVLSVPPDGRLMYWTTQGLGAVQASEAIPPGRLWAASNRSVDRNARFVFGNKKSLHLIRFNLDQVDASITTLRLRSEPAAVVFAGDTPFAIHPAGCDLINPDTGEAAQEVVLPNYVVHQQGRYFSTPQGEWYALAFDGISATLERVPTKGDVTGLWDQEGHEGPMAISSGGSIYGLSDGVVKIRCSAAAPLYGASKQTSDWRLLSASPCGLGLRVSCRHQGARREFSVDFTNRRVWPAFDDTVDPTVSRLAQPLPIRNRFRSVGLTVDGALGLRSNKGKVLAITRHQSAVLLRADQRSELRAEVAFESFDAGDRRYKLSAASWPDGSRAVLDSRGLLHLSPASGDVGEVTLVLSEGELSGWFAGGDEVGKGSFGKDSHGLFPLKTPTNQAANLWVLENAIRPFAEAIRANA